jgi:zinc transporter ZupT
MKRGTGSTLAKLKDLTLPQSPGIAAPALATVVGLAGAAVGLWLTGAHRRARLLVPFSAGVLLGVALFGLIPELALESGWPQTLALFVTGYGVLLAVNRYVYPVCPTCSHSHNHNACATELHGFAAPLIAAAALHSFLDGWSVATSEVAVPLGLRLAVPLAVGLHKLPEGIALGGILRVSVKSRAQALGWCAVAEGATLLGGVVALWIAPHIGPQWLTYPLGIMAGWLFFLGSHAVHEEWKRSGAVTAFASAVGGIAGAALLQRGAEALFH